MQIRAKVVIATLPCCVLLVICADLALTWYLRREDAALAPSSGMKFSYGVPSAARSTVDEAERPKPRPLQENLISGLESEKGFEIAYRVSAIPDPVRAVFAATVGEEQFSMAEPGAPWNPTDAGLPGRSFRRHFSVATGQGDCLVFYEHGGWNRSNSVAAFRISGRIAEFTGHAYLDDKDPPKDPAELFRAFYAGRTQAGFP